MRYSEQFMEHIEYAFHAFCKVVLRHEAINAWRDLKRKMEREISLDYPFEAIEKAVVGEPEAVDAVLRHYTAYIKYLSMYKGYINDDTQDRLKTKLVEAILKFRFDR